MDASQTRLLEGFFNKLQNERRLSPHTLKNYRRDLQTLQAFCASQSVSAWQDLQEAHIRQFVSQRHREGLAGKSLQRVLSSIRTFFDYLVREKAARVNPARSVRAPKSARRLPGTLDVDRVGQLLNIEGNEPLAVRDRAILELFYSSGLRLSELTGLDINSLSGGSQVRVLGKGAKERVLPVGRKAQQAIQDWLAVRNELAAEGETALFVSSRGTRLSARSVQQRLRHWVRKQGLDTHVHPHMLRHSFASHMLESSSDLRAVQELLGHADISTTQVYTHLDFQHLASVYDQAHPRARTRSKK